MRNRFESNGLILLGISPPVTKSPASDVSSWYYAGAGDLHLSKTKNLPMIGRLVMSASHIIPEWGPHGGFIQIRDRKLFTSLTTCSTRHCEGVFPKAISCNRNEIASSGRTAKRPRNDETAGSCLFTDSWRTNPPFEFVLSMKVRRTLIWVIGSRSTSRYPLSAAGCRPRVRWIRQSHCMCRASHFWKPARWHCLRCPR